MVSVTMDTSKGAATSVAGEKSASSSVEYSDSTFYSSSNSSAEDCRATATNPKRHLNLKRLFGKHAANAKSSSPPDSPITEYSSPATSPDRKSVLHDIFGSKGGRKPMTGSIQRKGGSKLSVGKNGCDLSTKYGVCEKGCIGEGATAVVRLASKPGSTKLYAIKEFRHRRKNETEKQYIKKLTSEFCISSSLHHPNIVETVDLMKDERGGWVEVMEYVPTDLYNVIKSGPMGNAEAGCCFKQLARGIAYMHSMGVAHRDLKPENLLMNEQGQLKITDFGIADVFRVTWETQAHLSQGLCGSEPYIAPEEFSQREYDAQLVDVWSLGIIYYCLMFEGIPFLAAQPSDPNYSHYLEAHASRSYGGFEKLPELCRDLLYRILEPNTKKRITIAEILDNEWFNSIEVCSDCQTNSGEHHHVPAACLRTSPKSRA